MKFWYNSTELGKVYFCRVCGLLFCLKVGSNPYTLCGHKVEPELLGREWNEIEPVIRQYIKTE